MNRKTLILLLAASFSSIASSSHAGNSVSYGGFISNGYINSAGYNYLVDSKDGDFDFVEMGINAVWSPFDRATVNGQLFAFELGPYGNYEPLIDYLFFDYNFSQNLGVRVGRIKKPSGIYNDIQDIDLARTSILLPIGIYDPRYRDFSAAVDGLNPYGFVSIGKAGGLDYSAYIGRSNLEPDGGLGGSIVSSLSRRFANPSVDDINQPLTWGGQLWWNTPVAGLRLGAAYQLYKEIESLTTGAFPENFPSPFLAGQDFVSNGLTDVGVWLLSAEYYIGNWVLVAEATTSTTTSLRSQRVGNFPAVDEATYGRSEGIYGSISRRFLEKFEAGVTYTEFYGNANDHAGLTYPIPHSAYNKDLQISIRWDATANWSLKLEYHDIKGTNRVFNQYGQNPVLDRGSWSMWAAKSTLSF